MTLAQAIISGLKESAHSAAERELQTKEPLAIVNESLIPALDRVGKDFETGKLFLPQLLMSADAAKAAFEEVRAQLNQRSIRYNWHEPDVTALEGFLARGDRRCADVILKAYEKGALYDAWTENFDYDIWKEAMAECGVDMTFYTLRERSLDEILPWDFIDTGVSRRFLEREWQRAKEGVVTENCRQKCSACGAMKFKGGVCLEGKN